MAEQRFGGDLRVYGKAFVEQQGTGDTAVVARLLLSDRITFATNRANHTGTQLFSTISDGTSYVDGRIQAIVDGAPAALDTLKEIADRLIAGDTAADALTQQVATNRADIDALTPRVTTAESDIDTLQSDVAANTSDITALQTDVATAKSNIATNTGSITALRTDLTSTQSALTALTTRVSTAESDIDQLQSDLAALSSSGGSATATLRSDLDALTARVTATETVANAAATQTALAQEVNDRTAADNALDARLDALEVPTIFKQTIGNGTDSLLTVTHALNSQDVELVVRDLTLSGQRVFPVDSATGANTVSLDFGSYVPPANSIRVVVKAY